MKTVSLQALPDYQRESIEKAMEALLAPLGGMQAFVKPGQKVLIKPNMLSGKPPERAVTTHPAVVRDVIRRVQAAGGSPLVGDSPGVGTCRQVAHKCGIMDVVHETGARLAPFTESIQVTGHGNIFHHLELARDVISADVIINLPKLKTHQMMGITGAVKNMFGAVVGMRKPRLHLQAGSDKAFFARMLLELCERVKPDLTIVDAGLAMEGDGPGSGTPVWIGALLAGDDPVAVDTLALDLLGLPPHSCWTQKIAIERNLAGSTLDQIKVSGTSVASLRPAHFQPSRSTDVNFGLPPWIRNRLKRSLSALPKVEQTTCRSCGLCVQHCPPQAMALKNERLEIDFDCCISCFCCQELCPHGAIATRQGLLLRLTDFLNRRP